MDVAGAHEAERYSGHGLDLVITNGVSMYFPSADYLLQVPLQTVVSGCSRFLLWCCTTWVQSRCC